MGSGKTATQGFPGAVLLMARRVRVCEFWETHDKTHDNHKNSPSSASPSFMGTAQMLLMDAARIISTGEMDLSWEKLVGALLGLGMQQ